MGFQILIAVVVAAFLVVVIILVRSLKHSSLKGSKKSAAKKGTGPLYKEAEKRLAKNPHDVEALETIGDLYFQDKNWEKIWNVYKTLYDISSAHPEINIAKTTLRMGIAAFNIDPPGIPMIVPLPPVPLPFPPAYPPPPV